MKHPVITYKASSSLRGGGGGGGTPLYKLYRYVPPHQVGFLRRFGLKTGIHFAHFGLESGMVFERTTECINVSVSFQIQISKKEREIYLRIRNGFE